MSYFNKLVAILWMFSTCSSLDLTYNLPKDMCDPSFNFSGISIGAQIQGKPELVFFVENSVWYWSENQQNWETSSLPWNWTTFGSEFTAIRRNFVEGTEECGEQLNDFFVIWYNPNTGRHEYDIFRPPSTWYYSSGSAPKPLKQHYIFKEIERALNQSFESNNRLTAAFSYKDYVVVFQRSKYYTLRLNQTNCDTNTDLSLTVEGLQIFDDFPMEPISVFFYNTDIHFFTKSGSGYEYQIYQSASISQSGQINGRLETKAMFGNFFNCRTPTSNSITIESSSEWMSGTTLSGQVLDLSSKTDKTVLLDENQTKATKRKDSPTVKPTNSPSNVMKILFIILLVSIIAALIICIICCFCNKTLKSKSSEKHESGAQKDMKDVEKPAVPTTVTKAKSQENLKAKSQTDRQVTENVEMDATNDNDIQEGNESNQQMNETEPVPNEYLDENTEAPKKEKKGYGRPKNPLNKLIVFFKGTPVPPDEGKPRDPFEGLP